MQADAPSRMTIEDVRNFYVKNKSGGMVPLERLLIFILQLGLRLFLFIIFILQVIFMACQHPVIVQVKRCRLLEKLAKQVLPAGVSYEWTSTAYQEKIAGNMSYYIFLLSLILVYLILAGQYENWVTPLAILFSVPLALIGTVLALSATWACLTICIPRLVYCF